MTTVAACAGRAASPEHAELEIYCPKPGRTPLPLGGCSAWGTTYPAGCMFERGVDHGSVRWICECRAMSLVLGNEPDPVDSAGNPKYDWEWLCGTNLGNCRGEVKEPQAHIDSLVDIGSPAR